MNTPPNTPTGLLEGLKAELHQHNITYEAIAMATKAKELNAGRGYSIEKVKNIFAGRVAIQSDVMALAISMVEQSIERLEKLANGNMMPLIERLEISRNRRIELQSKWLLQ